MKNKLTVYKAVFVFALFHMVQNLPAQIINDTIFFNLKQLLSLAAENNKDLQLVRLDLQKSNQQIALKKSMFLPRVDVFADYYWYLGNVPLAIFPEKEGNILSGGASDGFYPVSIGLPNNLLAGVSLSQRIFDFSYLSSGKSREVLSAIESGKLKEKKEQLFYDVAVCYYEISRLAAKQDFMDFNIKRINRMMEILQIQLNDQMTDSLQMLDLELKKEELLMKKSELVSGMQTRTNYLKMLVGLPDSIIIDYGALDYSSTLDFQPDSNDFKANTQMILLNQAQSMNDLLQKRIQSEYLPTLDFRLNYLWNSQSQDLGFFSNQSFSNNISTLGLKLNVPIYHGAEKKKKIRELEIDNLMLDLQKQKLREGIQLQYSNSIKELEFKTALFKQQQKITQLKKRYLEKADKRFEQGILPIKDLLEAQSGFLEEQMKSAEIFFDLKLAELEYFKWSNQILTRFE
jgi:outer membrane protein TolC